MGDYNDETVKKLEELQEYSYGDKLTMAITGENPDTGEKNAIGKTADESEETNDKIDADVTPRLRTIVTNTRQTADNVATTNGKLDSDVTPKLAAIQAATEKGNDQLDTIDADIKASGSELSAKVDAVNESVQAGTKSTGAKLDVLDNDVKAGTESTGAKLDALKTATTANGTKADTGNASLASIEELVGNISANVTGYTAGDGLKLEDKEFSVTPATTAKIGGVKVGTGLAVTDDGTLSASGGADYTAGNGIDITEGKISIAAPAANHVDVDGNYTAFQENSNAGNWEQYVGKYAHSEGFETIAGNYSHAEGYRCHAIGAYNHVEGYFSNVGYNAKYAHAEGYSTLADANYSHAEGYNGGQFIYNGNYIDAGVSNGIASHCENKSTASGDYSHSEGNFTYAKGNSSHAEGSYTYASGENQHVGGKYNIEDAANKYAEIIGNGTYTTKRNSSNARTLDWEGVGWYQKDVRCGGADQDASDAISLTAINDVVKTVPAIEFGTSNSVTVPGNSHTLVDVNFHGAKTEIPVVFPAIQCPTAGVNLVATIQSVTNSQASICITNLGTADVDNITVDFLAISGR